MKLTAHLYPVPRSRMHVAKLPFPSYAFMKWCLIMHGIYFYLLSINSHIRFLWELADLNPKLMNVWNWKKLTHWLLSWDHRNWTVTEGKPSMEKINRGSSASVFWKAQGVAISLVCTKYISRGSDLFKEFLSLFNSNMFS